MIINKRYMLDAIEQFSAGQKDDIAFMKLLSEFDSFCFQELRRYKSAHADMVKRCALLRQRPDLPVDRIPAYQELLRLQDRDDGTLSMPSKTNPDFDEPIRIDHLYNFGVYFDWDQPTIGFGQFSISYKNDGNDTIQIDTEGMGRNWTRRALHAVVEKILAELFDENGKQK